MIIYIVSTLISRLECNGVLIFNYPPNMEKFKNCYQNAMGCLVLFSVLENNVHLKF
jgi:hypothetical protein